MIKSLFVSVNILVGAFGFATPLSTVDSVQTTEVSSVKQRYEVVAVVEGDGVYLEGKNKDTVYLVEDDFSSELALGETVTIVFDAEGDIVEIMEVESKYYQYKVTDVVEGDGVYLESEDSEVVYLAEDDFSTTLSMSDIISISFDKDGDIKDIIEDVKKVGIY